MVVPQVVLSNWALRVAVNRRRGMTQQRFAAKRCGWKKDSLRLVMGI